PGCIRRCLMRRPWPRLPRPGSSRHARKCSGRSRALGLEAEAGKEQVNLSFELGSVVAEQCRAKQSLQIGGDDLGHTLGVKFGWQFPGVLGGSKAVRNRADKSRHILLNELL